MEIDTEKLKTEKAEIEEFLARPEAYVEEGFAEKSRRLAELNEILELDQQIKQAKQNLVEATELVNDPELGEMAREDVRSLELKIEAWTAELEEKLLPHDPNDDKPAIMEIRAGAMRFLISCDAKTLPETAIPTHLSPLSMASPPV